MKKSEKTELTKEKIFSAALMEFGNKGYNNSSLNSICSNNKISKGLIYHNFKSKDDIYLLCVEYVFDMFMAFINKHYKGEGLRRYMFLRYEFFTENPLLGKMFFEAVLQPPQNLRWDIKALKVKLDEFNFDIYKDAIENITLREGITLKEAIEYYSVMIEMYSGYFSSNAYADVMFSEIMENESSLDKMFDFMIYGIANEKEKDI